eukprot:TRINITY_DN3040_c0_g1_i1.p1 TRINITY_DN3040_c0_g1~~TRINITY_DN3040_c0_g1_i1.p1  ORF type:complete len:1730 (-),score=606.38 TRINITY_DN3040_c0_g1_i1:52-5241(-)
MYRGLTHRRKCASAPTKQRCTPIRTKSTEVGSILDQTKQVIEPYNKMSSDDVLRRALRGSDFTVVLPDGSTTERSSTEAVEALRDPANQPISLKQAIVAVAKQAAIDQRATKDQERASTGFISRKSAYRDWWKATFKGQFVVYQQEVEIELKDEESVPIAISPHFVSLIEKIAEKPFPPEKLYVQESFQDNYKIQDDLAEGSALRQILESKDISAAYNEKKAQLAKSRSWAAFLIGRIAEAKADPSSPEKREDLIRTLIQVAGIGGPGNYHHKKKKINWQLTEDIQELESLVADYVDGDTAFVLSTSPEDSIEMIALEAYLHSFRGRLPPTKSNKITGVIRLDGTMLSIYRFEYTNKFIRELKFNEPMQMSVWPSKEGLDISTYDGLMKGIEKLEGYGRMFKDLDRTYMQYSPTHKTSHLRMLFSDDGAHLYREHKIQHREDPLVSTVPYPLIVTPLAWENPTNTILVPNATWMESDEKADFVNLYHFNGPWSEDYIKSRVKTWELWEPYRKFTKTLPLYYQHQNGQNLITEFPDQEDTQIFDEDEIVDMEDTKESEIAEIEAEIENLPGFAYPYGQLKAQFDNFFGYIECKYANWREEARAHRWETHWQNEDEQHRKAIDEGEDYYEMYEKLGELPDYVMPNQFKEFTIPEEAYGPPIVGKGIGDLLRKTLEGPSFMQQLHNSTKQVLAHFPSYSEREFEATYKKELKKRLDMLRNQIIAKREGKQWQAEAQERYENIPKTTRGRPTWVRSKEKKTKTHVTPSTWNSSKMVQWDSGENSQKIDFSDELEIQFENADLQVKAAALYNLLRRYQPLNMKVEDFKLKVEELVKSIKKDGPAAVKNDMDLSALTPTIERARNLKESKDPQEIAKLMQELRNTPHSTLVWSEWVDRESHAQRINTENSAKSLLELDRLRESRKKDVNGILIAIDQILKKNLEPTRRGPGFILKTKESDPVLNPAFSVHRSLWTDRPPFLTPEAQKLYLDLAEMRIRESAFNQRIEPLDLINARIFMKGEALRMKDDSNSEQAMSFLEVERQRWTKTVIDGIDKERIKLLELYKAPEIRNLLLSLERQRQANMEISKQYGDVSPDIHREDKQDGEMMSINYFDDTISPSVEFERSQAFKLRWMVIFLSLKRIGWAFENILDRFPDQFPPDILSNVNARFMTEEDAVRKMQFFPPEARELWIKFRNCAKSATDLFGTNYGSDTLRQPQILPEEFAEDTTEIFDLPPRPVQEEFWHAVHHFVHAVRNPDAKAMTTEQMEEVRSKAQALRAEREVSGFRVAVQDEIQLEKKLEQIYNFDKKVDDEDLKAYIKRQVAAHNEFSQIPMDANEWWCTRSWKERWNILAQFVPDIEMRTLEFERFVWELPKVLVWAQKRQNSNGTLRAREWNKWNMIHYGRPAPRAPSINDVTLPPTGETEVPKSLIDGMNNKIWIVKQWEKQILKDKEFAPRGNNLVTLDHVPADPEELEEAMLLMASEEESAEDYPAFSDLISSQGEVSQRPVVYIEDALDGLTENQNRQIDEIDDSFIKDPQKRVERFEGVEESFLEDFKENTGKELGQRDFERMLGKDEFKKESKRTDEDRANAGLKEEEALYNQEILHNQLLNIQMEQDGEEDSRADSLYLGDGDIRREMLLHAAEGEEVPQEYYNMIGRDNFYGEGEDGPVQASGFYNPTITDPANRGEAVYEDEEEEFGEGEGEEDDGEFDEEAQKLLGEIDTESANIDRTFFK